MNLLDIKEIKVGSITFYIKLTMRAMIEYENLSGGNIASMDTTEKVIMFFYTTAKAGAKAKGVSFEYTFDSFLDYLDTEDYMSAINDFTSLLSANSTTVDSKK